MQECLLITERYKGIEHPGAAANLVNLAVSYSRSKNFVEAERLLRMSLKIMTKTVGPNDQSVTVPMLQLAIALYHLKKDEEAERFALEAVRIREHAFGEETLPVGANHVLSVDTNAPSSLCKFHYKISISSICLEPPSKIIIAS